MSRIAHGIPVGGDLEYADEVTLPKSDGRQKAALRSHKPEKKEYSKEVGWSSFLYYNDRLFRLACCGVLRRKERQNGSGNGNQCFLAYTAGMLLLYFAGDCCLSP